MMALKTKGRNDTSQVWNFRGKYADYMRYLRGDGVAPPYHGIFDEIYHGYVFCGLYGLIKGVRHKYNPQADNPNNVEQLGFRWAYANSGIGIYNYDNFRKMILLFDRTSNRSFSDKVDNTLRFDYPTNDVSDEELIERSCYGDNSDLIDEYVLGGLELIYNKVIETASVQGMIGLMDDMIAEVQQAVEKIKEDSISEN